MNICIEKLNIGTHSKQEINRLLAEPQQSRTDLEQMWYLMDKIWEEYGCDNKKLDWGKIANFYSHPVWLLNGLFIEQHELSMQHREVISNWIVKHHSKRVIDYGGGHGTLAKLLSQKNPELIIDIYEPHPSEYALKEVSIFPNIHFVSRLNNYDCLISTDVIEHVPDPLLTLSEMMKSVHLQGVLIVANNFTPVIKCHLPQTFHLKYTFNRFAEMMGLEVLGGLSGSHAIIFKKVDEKAINWYKIRFFEYISKLCYPLIKLLHPVLIPKKIFF
jgi:2-polyprenyl-6-hydroxyphenyl methylase/3-demethylubiquinone-9 3-methyltransferase